MTAKRTALPIDLSDDLLYILLYIKKWYLSIVYSPVLDIYCAMCYTIIDLYRLYRNSGATVVIEYRDAGGAW